jgi:S1-C subfamily serine protease
VKILGSAPECGGELEGSGFVYAPQHVLTNAHVVAGVTQGQTVTTADGVTYRARVVFYDPRTDIAVLDVPGLRLAPLRFSTQASPGDNAVVAGYTESSQSFTAVPARIGQVLRADGPDIYGSGQVDRQIYQIRGAVQLGNFGGPLLSPGGTVDGVVFARAGSSSPPSRYRPTPTRAPTRRCRSPPRAARPDDSGVLAPVEGGARSTARLRDAEQDWPRWLPSHL